MPTDYSRKTFDRKKHYSGVLMQQGRVQVDADWNEQLDIHQYRTWTETRDVIGSSGVPKKNNGFRLTIIDNGNDIEIKPGRMYVGGLLCELEGTGLPVTYFHQPYYPDPAKIYFSDSVILSPPESPPSPPDSPPSPPDGQGIILENGTYIAYIQAWQIEVNQLDDPRIHEVALGTADTTTRLQNVWQVKLLKVGDPPSGVDPCDYSFPEWYDQIAPPTGKMNARTNTPATDPDPCLLAESSGYRRLENQLYRVEVHTGGDSNVSTFKWSRDNATVETKIESISGSTMVVSDLGKDEVLGFASNQWVEILDEDSVFNNIPNPLLKITGIDPDKREISFSESLAIYEGLPNLKLRRWDQNGSSADNFGVSMTNDWIKLEGGIEVKFSAGNYKSGDYWLIPARSATHEIEWPPYEIPNNDPVPQSPEGITDHYAKLAVISATDGHYTMNDCRDLFPALTELTAGDIFYDNLNCNLGDVKTVQDAIDLLCAASDLRRHNKLLHGYGVVCGLQMNCDNDRNNILVLPGTALDCEGNIIDLKKDQSFDIVDQAFNEELLTGTDGKVSVYISGTDGNNLILQIEKYEPKSYWEEIFEGSIWESFYNHCFKDLIDFFKNQFPTTLKDTAPPVSIKDKRVTILLNVMGQLINNKTGVYMFLSGQQGQSRDGMCDEGVEEITEDQILYCFYSRLKKLISSDTFCGMFDGDQPFPDYTIDPGLDTIFGPTFRKHYNLKLNTALNFAYTNGFDNKIFVYDLGKKEYVQVLEFPSSSNIIVSDIALNTKQDRLYAAGVLDNSDSILAYADINTDGTLQWAESSVKCGMKVVTLAVDPNDKIYAIAKQKGLYELIGIGTAVSFTINLISAFNATGLMVLSDDGNTAFAMANSNPADASTAFDQLKVIDISTNSAADFTFSGDNLLDDMVFHDGMVYATGTLSGPMVKIVQKFNNSGPVGGQINTGLSSPINVNIDMAGDIGNYLLMTVSTECKVVRISLDGAGSLDADYRIPVQIFPVNIQVNNKTKTGYVLNPYLNTLTVIDLVAAFDTVIVPNYTQEPPYEIREYRLKMVDAYSDMLSHFFQYVKDCFFSQYLIECPTCTSKDKIYLGTVEVKGGKVYNICNFTKREYVKSSEIWEYWLSTVPILPMVKKAFTDMACTPI